MYRVEVNKSRPDFRVFIDLLYGYLHNVDTDGDSLPVNSRTWTYLYIRDRESDDPPVIVHAISENQTIFEVESKSHELETLAALYMFLSCGTSISLEGRQLNPAEVDDLKKLYASQLQRAEHSIWHQSSDQRPYPNRP